MKDSEKEKRWTLLDDTVFCDFFPLPVRPLAKLSNQSLMSGDEWLTGGWLQQVGGPLNWDFPKAGPVLAKPCEL